MKPRISVLLPVYNGQRYIRAAIDSVLRQTFRNFELLIIDDGSTDSTGDIVNSFDDSRIRMVRNIKRLKLSGALNRGLDLSKGEYVARMDADDICFSDRLEIQSAYLDSHPELGICGSHSRIFGMKKWEVHHAPLGRDRVKAHMLFDNPFVHPAVMLRKDFFDRHGLRYNGDYYPTEDYELWSRALNYFSGDNIDRVLLKYRLHAASMTRADWNNMDEKATLIVGRLLKDTGLDVDPEALHFHRTIGREMSSACTSRPDILHGEKWFQYLMAINRKKRFVDETALADVSADAWFRLCFNSSGLGSWIVWKYAGSAMVGGRENRLFRAMLIYMSFLKKMMFQAAKKEPS